MNDTHETKVISDLLRNPDRVIAENREIGLTADHFMSPPLADAFLNPTARVEAGRSVAPKDLRIAQPDLLEAFNGFISGLAIFCQMALNREYDEAFKKSATEIKHSSLRRNAKSLKSILSR